MGSDTTAFGINEVRLPPGVEGPSTARTTRDEEVYVIIDGGRDVHRRRCALSRSTGGEYLRVEPGFTRLVVAVDDGLAYIAVAAKPLSEYDGRASL